MTDKHHDELKRHYYNYINEKNINKLFLKDEYFNVYIDIIKLFSKNPWTTQDDVFNTIEPMIHSLFKEFAGDREVITKVEKIKYKDKSRLLNYFLPG